MLLFYHKVVSNSLQPHGLWNTRLPCPLLSPRACSDSCPLSQWCIQPSHPLVTPFSSCHQSFPASGSFPTSQLFTSGSQSFGASASASVLSVHIQGWFPLGLTGIISLLWESSPIPQFESINSSALSLLYGSALTSIHDYWKNHSFVYTDLCQQSPYISTF